MTADDLWRISKRVDTLLVSAKDAAELRRKLNTLRKNGHRDWGLLRAPQWLGERLVAVAWKPAEE